METSDRSFSLDGAEKASKAFPRLLLLGCGAFLYLHSMDLFPGKGKMTNDVIPCSLQAAKTRCAWESDLGTCIAYKHSV